MSFWKNGVIVGPINIMEETMGDDFKVVIVSGTSSSGKTTVINAVRDMGYDIIEEGAAEVITRWKAAGRPLPVEDPSLWDEFEGQIASWYDVAMDRFDPAGSRGLFVDRSQIDNLAFLRLNAPAGTVVPDMPGWLRMPHDLIGVPAGSVSSVILAPLPMVDNGIRYEKSDKEREDQLRELSRAYGECPYRLEVERRAGTVEERVRLLLSLAG